MKKFLTFTLGAVIAIAAPLAHADTIGTIGFTGGDTFNTTTQIISFTNASVNANAVGTGVFSAFTAASMVSFNSFNYKTVPSGFILMTATAPTGQVLTFTLSSETSIVGTDAFNNTTLDIAGNGTYTVTGMNGSVTSGNFHISSSGYGSTTANVTFQDTAIAATPEPSSLVLLGTGLFSAGGMLVRRRRAAVTA